MIKHNLQIGATGEWYCINCGLNTGIIYSNKKPELNSECNNILEATTKKCSNLKEEINLIECDSCSGSVKIKIFECSIHKECTIAKQIENIKCCQTCKDFTI